MTPVITVVVPTVGRPEMLRRCLEHLAAQTIAPERFEALVIIDGDDPASASIAGEFATRRALQLRCESQAKLGPSVARNRSIDLARAEIIHFINDDILLDPRNLEIHLLRHAAQPGHGVRGNTRWPDRADRSPFGQWLVGQWGEYARLIRDPDDIGYEFFHTCDLSIHRQWFADDRFSPDFPYPSLEDTEMGWRLCSKGLKLVWAPEAKSFHDHEYSEADFYEKARVNGASAAILAQKIPALYDRVVGHFRREPQWRRRLRLARLRLSGRAATPEYWQTKHDLIYAAAAIRASKGRG